MLFLHPLERLALWTVYMQWHGMTSLLKKRGVCGASSAIQRACSLFDSVCTEDADAVTRHIELLSSTLRSRFSVVDHPLRFPRLETSCPGQASVLISTMRENFDLTEAIFALQRGVAIDWNAARRYWAVHPITDHQQFSRFLSIWPGALQVPACGVGGV